jgi:uncharacterized YigZ family protein
MCQNRGPRHRICLPHATNHAILVIAWTHSHREGEAGPWANMERYLVPAREARIQNRVANSRFIATAAPVFTVEEAKVFTGRIKHEFADATHNVSAYLIGHGRTVIAHCHDDGEPGGTAGRPALAVLRGSGLGNVAVVVTRYFGGTKLGTGGLVRAYSDAVRDVLAALPRAVQVTTHTVVVVTPYTYFERLSLLIGAHQGQILHQDFAAEVTVTARFAAEHFPDFQAALQEMSNGALEAEIVETNEATIMPLDRNDSNEIGADAGKGR